MSLRWAGSLCLCVAWAWGCAAFAQINPGEWGGGSGGVAAGGAAAAAYPKYAYGPEAISDGYTTAFLNVTIVEQRNLTEDVRFERERFQSSPAYDCGRRSMEGKYGEAHIGTAFGQVVHIASVSSSDDHSGCEKPFNGTRPIPDGPWIALIKRGKCNFDDKVQNAFDSKAVGVLIYNDRESVTLEKMKLATNRNRNISAVFTYKFKGEEIARLVDKGVKVMLHITVASYCVATPNNMNRTSVMFVTISFIVLMVMSLSWLVFYYIQRFRYMNAKDRLSKRLCCAAKKALSKIPIKNLKFEDREVQGDGECCAICIEPYKISDTLRVLPCRHDFHKSCIDPWLLEHRTCPMCKMDILKYYGFVFTGSQESILQLDSDERTTVAVSPFPPQQISRANSYEASVRSSRASSPDEMTPTLHQSAGSISGSSSPQFSTYLPHSSSDPTLYGGKRPLPGVHSVPGCSGRPVDTTIISSEHIDDNELRDSV